MLFPSRRTADVPSWIINMITISVTPIHNVTW